jgi:hypothetical protein
MSSLNPTANPTLVFYNSLPSAEQLIVKAPIGRSDIQATWAD